MMHPFWFVLLANSVKMDELPFFYADSAVSLHLISIKIEKDLNPVHTDSIK